MKKWSICIIICLGIGLLAGCSRPKEETKLDFFEPDYLIVPRQPGYGLLKGIYPQPGGEYQAHLNYGATNHCILSIYWQERPEVYWVPGLDDVTGLFWAPDGRYLYVTSSCIYGIGGVWRLDLPSKKKESIFTVEDHNDALAQLFSADWEQRTIKFYFTPKVDETDFNTFWKDEKNIVTLKLPK